MAGATDVTEIIHRELQESLKNLTKEVKMLSSETSPLVQSCETAAETCENSTSKVEENEHTNTILNSLIFPFCVIVLVLQILNTGLLLFIKKGRCCSLHPTKQQGEERD